MTAIVCKGMRVRFAAPLAVTTVAGMFVDENVGGPISKHRPAPHPISGGMPHSYSGPLAGALEGVVRSRRCALFASPGVPQKRTGERGW